MTMKFEEMGENSVDDGKRFAFIDFLFTVNFVFSDEISPHLVCLSVVSHFTRKHYGGDEC